MAISPLTAFAIGWIASFLGTLPFGPINLSVVNTTIKKSFKAGLGVALAAALIEIIQSFIAIHCSMVITHFLSESPFIKVLAIGLFIVLGLFFFFKKNKNQKVSTSKKKSDNSFIQGLAIALFNPQAIPFWIFVLTYLETSRMIHLSIQGEELQSVIFFLIGVSIGKLCALILFGLLSKVISKKSTRITLMMNKIIGSILLVIGLVQAVQLILG